MRASGHHVDARFVVARTLHVEDFLFRMTRRWRLLDCHVAYRDRLQTAALLSGPGADLTSALQCRC